VWLKSAEKQRRIIRKVKFNLN